jgi:hypothetical protein
MAITGINNSSYTSYYASNYKNTVKKTDSEKDSTNTKDGNVTTSTVELKTSRPGVTKTEQIKTGYSNVNDYSKYLQGKHTYLLQESGKTINVDAKIKQLNDINWIEIGYKEGDTFSVYGKEYAIDSSGHINVSAEDEFTSTEIKYPSRSI